MYFHSLKVWSQSTCTFDRFIRATSREQERLNERVAENTSNEPRARESNDARSSWLPRRSNVPLLRDESTLAHGSYSTKARNAQWPDTASETPDRGKFRMQTGSFFFLFIPPSSTFFPDWWYLSRDLDAVDLAPEETRFHDTLSL